MFRETLRKSAKVASTVAWLALILLMVRGLLGGVRLSLFGIHLIGILILWLVVFIVVAPLAFLDVFFMTDGAEDVHAEDEEVPVDEKDDLVELERPSFDLSDPDAIAYCPTCGAGYGRNADHCVECDTELLPRAEVEKRLAREVLRKDLGTTIPLCKVANAEAWLLAAELEQAGISFFTKEHGIQGINWGGVKLPAIEFFVPREKIEDAERVLKNIEDREEITDVPGEVTEP